MPEPIDYYDEYFSWLIRNFPNTKDGYIVMFEKGYQFEEFLEERNGRGLLGANRTVGGAEP